MAKQLLFIQGAGEGAYEEDALLVERLMNAVGTDYDAAYPAMINEGDAPYESWKQHIEREVAGLPGPILLVGHSVGASVLLKWMAESEPSRQIAGLFLLATPYWGGQGWRYDGYEELELPPNAPASLSQGVPIFFYHCQDDEVIPVEHLDLFKRLLPHATCRQLTFGGHQLECDLSPISRDIQGLQLEQSWRN